MHADFSGEQVVQRHMSRLGRELLYHRIEAASGTSDRKALDLVLQEYGSPILPMLSADSNILPILSADSNIKDKYLMIRLGVKQTKSHSQDHMGLTSFGDAWVEVSSHCFC